MCCTMRSRLGDEFYGQWLFLHVPFRSMKELDNPDVRRRVPSAMHNFGLALWCDHPVARGFWRNEEGMIEEMQKDIGVRKLCGAMSLLQKLFLLL